MNTTQDKQQLHARYESLKQQKPAMRARDMATELGISEGELVALRTGNGITRLIDDAQAILKAVSALGEVMALTRNDSCVHERKGVYNNVSFSKHGPMAMGLVVNPDIDLRLFMNHWQHNFAVVEETSRGSRKSLQFFDKTGTAIHKIYLTENSDEQAYDLLVEQLSNMDQSEGMQIENYETVLEEKQDDEVDWTLFRTAWENLKDTHDFHPMLRKFKVGREQAFARIGRDFAYEVDNNAAREVLNLVRARDIEMMVFVGNRGCIQIHTGPVKKLLEHQDWYNVMDPIFNLHLRESQIYRTWVTKKPSEDGIITALEIFDQNSDIIATFFGKRKPCIPELTAWREIIDLIPAKQDKSSAA